MTRGSGNHFIEVTVDESDRAWLFLHSGSRGVGNKIAQKHIAVGRDEAVVDQPAGPRPRSLTKYPPRTRTSTR